MITCKRFTVVEDINCTIIKLLVIYISSRVSINTLGSVVYMCVFSCASNVVMSSLSSCDVAPNDKMKEVLRRTVSEARAAISKVQFICIYVYTYT